MAVISLCPSFFWIQIERNKKHGLEPSIKCQLLTLSTSTFTFSYTYISSVSRDVPNVCRQIIKGLQWSAYQEANELFAQVILNAYQHGDVVWCHDYHLMLLPSKLKEEHPGMKVGWFLHTPFPSSEIYRMLPVREELLLSVWRADFWASCAATMIICGLINHCKSFTLKEA